MKKQRKLAFYEIGKSGNYASLMQREFEQAQRICLDTNKPVTVVSRITIKTPKNIGERFGQISFEVYPVIPHQKSIDFLTEIEDGVIVATDDSEVNILQESLELEMPDISQFKEVQGE
jgi:hypothetical protein